MHPGIRVLMFLVFAASLALYSRLVYFALVPVGAAYFYFGPAVFPLLHRLRWLLLSFMLFALVFPPGGYQVQAVLDSLGFALERILVLVVIALAAQLLLHLTPLPHLVAALEWLLAPLERYAKVPVSRFTLRLGLVLDAVDRIRPIYAEAFPNGPPKPSLGHFSTGLQRLLASTLAHAEHAPLPLLELEILGAPPWWQWLVPAGLALGVYFMV